MSKRLLILAALVLCVSLSAGDSKTALFETFYDSVAKETPERCQVRKDSARRILFMDMPVPVKSSDAGDISGAKAAVLKSMKSSPETGKLFREADITMIVNYITTDHKILSVVISKEDF